MAERASGLEPEFEIDAKGDREKSTHFSSPRL
uniref:Uncharacterized protein n=1 Tax=Anguilla anguilla TaxID=7936 RepID=A0A0E9VWP4_ANGAN